MEGDGLPFGFDSPAGIRNLAMSFGHPALFLSKMYMNILVNRIKRKYPDMDIRYDLDGYPPTLELWLHGRPIPDNKHTYHIEVVVPIYEMQQRINHAGQGKSVQIAHDILFERCFDDQYETDVIENVMVYDDDAADAIYYMYCRAKNHEVPPIPSKFRPHYEDKAQYRTSRNQRKRLRAKLRKQQQ